MIPIQLLNSRPRSRPNSRNLRAGLSLLEVTIVLVIMVGVTALVWPNLQKKLQRTSLDESAAMVRELLSETRYRASEKGQSFVVRLETGSNELSVGSVEQFLSEPELSSSQRATESDSTSGLTARSPLEETLELKVLPKSIVVSDVRWAVPAAESTTKFSSESSFAGDSIDQSARTDANSADALMPPNVTIETIVAQAFWLPILAGIGQGRDVTITLTDTEAHESIEVYYCAATGAAEVSP
jgi:Tfp pilus assembly protein FimT